MDLLFLLQTKLNCSLLRRCTCSIRLNKRTFTSKLQLASDDYVASIRNAEKSDYEEVMAIDRHWCFGNDLLVNYYHKYMDDKQKFGYVITMNGDTAGFFIHEPIDDAERCCGQFARIKQEYTGKNIFGKYFRSLWNISDIYPNCKTLIFTSVEDKAVNTYTKHFQTSRIVLKRNIGYGEMDNCNIDRHMLELNRMSTNVEKSVFDATGLMPRERILDILQNPKLVPEKRWVIKWLPYAQMQANIEAVLNLEPVVFGTQGRESQKTIAVSFGSASWVPRGFLYTTDFHSSKFDNFDVQMQVLSCHLIKHLNNALTTAPKKPAGLKIIFEILYPSSLENANVRDMLHTCLKMTKPNQDFNCYVVEDRLK